MSLTSLSLAPFVRAITDSQLLLPPPQLQVSSQVMQPCLPTPAAAALQAAFAYQTRTAIDSGKTPVWLLQMTTAACFPLKLLSLSFDPLLLVRGVHGCRQSLSITAVSLTAGGSVPLLLVSLLHQQLPPGMDLSRSVP